MFRSNFFKLTTSNCKQIIPELLKSPESKDKQLLIHLIVKASLIRPFSLSAYAEFTINSLVEDNYKKNLLSSLLDPDSEYPGNIVLTYHLWKRGYYTAEEITNTVV